ncbi:hypothetical protein [Niabella soli]|uniref:Uncharacterized protein n=1 Tax=Niabella soli DSM 19437 TaxID=929713 RepID=W0EZU5_9BACT|nr:hypothetical protein [Niabella soli]AHF14704.1 hypothetical protein NIASO_04875 [Niabella soli DSM 19437]
MKGPDYMSQLNGREQNAFYCIKKLVAARLQPLIIYCYGCETLVHTRRNCFMTKQRTEQRQFSCDLLLITPDECVIDDALKTEVQEITSHLGKVNMIIHPLSFVIQQLNAQNLFFNWICRNGMLLFDKNASTQLLPAAIGREYRRQAEEFYTGDPEMTNYLEEKLQPVVATQHLKKEHNQELKPMEIRLTLDPGNGWWSGI